MVKEKMNSIRTYDKDGYRRRAACLCFRDESEKEDSRSCSSMSRMFMNNKWLLMNTKLFFILIIRVRSRDQCLLHKTDCNWRRLMNEQILLVSSSKYQDRWVVPGGGIEPEEEPNLAAEREALEEAGAKGVLGRLLGVFENKEKKHKTSLYAFTVTDLLDEWEDAKMFGRQRNWFHVNEARNHLSHKPVQATYLEFLSKDLNGVVK